MSRPLSSAEIERDFPFVTRILFRTHWLTHEQLTVNQFVGDLGGTHRRGDFNAIRRYHFGRPDHATALSEFILCRRLDRPRVDCHDGASREDVLAEWARIEQERAAILAWGRRAGRLQAVVQAYRFSRRVGDPSGRAHGNAARVVAGIDPAMADPMNCAGVLIEWAEREHRGWFWRCCRDHHVL